MMIYRVALMPSFRNRPGYANPATSITVHNTGNPDATAAAHVAYLNKQARSASWHITVDDIEAVLHIPLNEQAWHAGTPIGNKTSIGIEVCEFTDPLRTTAAIGNAARLIAEMLDGTAPMAFDAHHLGLNNVRTHESWHQYGADKPGKYCPHVILDRGWNNFLAAIASYMGAAPAPAPAPTPAPVPESVLLRVGSRGDAVKRLQAALNTHGARVAVDGIFGPGTLAAVRNFQATKGLTVDGIVGPATQAKLAENPYKPQPAKQQVTVKRGSRGAAVHLLQERLRWKGYAIAVDGIFGPDTEFIVKSFQRLHGLAADGIVGPRTWGALL